MFASLWLVPLRLAAVVVQVLGAQHQSSSDDEATRVSLHRHHHTQHQRSPVQDPHSGYKRNSPVTRADSETIVQTKIKTLPFCPGDHLLISCHHALLDESKEQQVEWYFAADGGQDTLIGTLKADKTFQKGEDQRVTYEGKEVISISPTTLNDAGIYSCSIAYSQKETTFDFDTLQVVSKACPKGWTVRENSDSCYLFIEEPLPWNIARDKCMHTENSKLVEIQSREEDEFISELTKSAAVWLGIYDKGEEGKWVLASTNTAATYTNWASGAAPENPEKDCGATADGWHDYQCGGKLPFVCQTSSKC